MRSLSLVLSLLLIAADVAGQTAPPTLLKVMPTGAQRGTQVQLTIEGSNIDGTTELIFPERGFSSRITAIKEIQVEKPKMRPGVVRTDAPIEDGARRYLVTAVVTIDASVPPGVHAFRVRTPLGVSNLLRLAVSRFPDVPESDAAARRPPVDLPATFVGILSEAGETDAFEFRGKAGEELVFAAVARALGSPMDSVLRLLDSRGNVVAENNDLDLSRDAVLGVRIPASGVYRLVVEDFEHAGGWNYWYRIHAGAFPYITSAFPLGLREGTTSEIELTGFNLGNAWRVRASGDPGKTFAQRLPLDVTNAHGPSLNRKGLALGRHAEALEAEPNDEISKAQPIAAPLTVNGKIARPADSRKADEDYFRFRARAGQSLVFDVAAQGLGSPLDSVVEVLNAEGHPVPRGTVRCVAQTRITLNDPDAGRRGIRLASWNDFAIDDYVMIGDEILQVQSMPTHPDDDMVFKGYRGPRVGFFDTTPRNHSVDAPVYKVEIHPPGARFPPNGMPVFTLTYMNDDGGPRYGGKDSRLHFTAPADGEYLLRLRDIRGIDGERFAYRLTVREPAPDFDLIVEPASFNLPRGGHVSLTVTAERVDGFSDAIDVEVTGLSAGLSATKGRIEAGEDTTVLMIAAAADVSFDTATVELPSMYAHVAPRTQGARGASHVARKVVSLQVTGTAAINGSAVRRTWEPREPLSIVALAPKPDLHVTTDAQVLRLAPGGAAHVTVTVDRRNGFTGRVPLSVMNLPHGVRVNDVGLNGVMITEEETSRTFEIVAEPWVRPTTRPLLIVGRVEVNSPLRNESAAPPITLTIGGDSGTR